MPSVSGYIIWAMTPDQKTFALHMVYMNVLLSCFLDSVLWSDSVCRVNRRGWHSSASPLPIQPLWGIVFVCTYFQKKLFTTGLGFCSLFDATLLVVVVEDEMVVNICNHRLVSKKAPYLHSNQFSEDLYRRKEKDLEKTMYKTKRVESRSNKSNWLSNLIF